jgi:hypothetical protein
MRKDDEGGYRCEEMWTKRWEWDLMFFWFVCEQDM